MKIEFALRTTLKPLTGNVNEYVYVFRFVGMTNYGHQYKSTWNRYSAYTETAKEAKKNIIERLTNQGAFDCALDGMCPYENNCL